MAGSTRGLPGGWRLKTTAFQRQALAHTCSHIQIYYANIVQKQNVMSLTKKEPLEPGIYTDQETTERSSPLHPSSAAAWEMIITAFLEGIHQNNNEKLETSTAEGPGLAEEWGELKCKSRFLDHSSLPANLRCDSPVPFCLQHPTPSPTPPHPWHPKLTLANDLLQRVANFL